MKKVAILAADYMLAGQAGKQGDSVERDEQMGKIIPAFKAQGMNAELVRWRSAAKLASEFDAMLPLFVLFNSFSVLQWNSEKTYLDRLAKEGAPVIETIILERVTQTGVSKAFKTLQTDKLVIKPLIGGGAWRQVLYTKGDSFPSKKELPPEGAMVQAFLPSVTKEGEYSFLYFGGQFSHGLIKRPKAGDYRIQSIYGGTEEKYSPNAAEKDTARRVLDTLNFTPLYARVDLLRGLDGRLKLIELEMIEPYLYLLCADGDGADNKGAQKLAAALKSLLK